MTKKNIVPCRKCVVVVVFIILLMSLCINGIYIIQSFNNNRVAAVPDGDSLDLADGRRVRLLGIDAPEIGRCVADEARERLKRLTLGKHVRLKNTVTDDYGRVLANVIVEDLPSWLAYMRWWIPKHLGLTVGPMPDPMVNRVLVTEGLARFMYVTSPYYQILKNAQENAKTRGLGIFSPQCRSMDPQSDCLIKGNIRQGKKTFFNPTCSNYSQVIIDTSFGDQWFCSEEEAKESGYTISATCR